jgi:hypothetical protein
MMETSGLKVRLLYMTDNNVLEDRFWPSLTMPALSRAFFGFFFPLLLFLAFFEQTTPLRFYERSAACEPGAESRAVRRFLPDRSSPDP